VAKLGPKAHNRTKKP